MQKRVSSGTGSWITTSGKWGRFRGYAIAVGAVGLAAALRWGLTGCFGEGLPPYITFYPAVMLVALIAGLGPGCLATVTAAVVVDYWLLSPTGWFGIASASDAVGLALFTGMGVFMSTVAELYRRVRQKAAAYDLKRAEESLRESEERAKLAEAVRAERQRFQDVLDMLPAYVVLLSPDYHVPFANLFFEDRFGKSNGKRCYEYLFSRPEPCQKCETYSVLKTNARHRWDWAGPDGRTYDIHDFPFTDADGSKLIMEVGLDVTEVKKAQTALKEANDRLEQRVAERTAALAESEERLRLALGATELGTWDYNPLTGALKWDARCKELFGLPPEVEVNYDTFLDGVHSEDREQTHQVVQRTFDPANGGFFDCEYRTVGLRDGGKVRWIRATGRAFFNEAGQAIRFIGTVQDLTDRKRAQQENGVAAEFLKLVNDSSGLSALIEGTVRFFHKLSGCEAVGIRLQEGEDFPYYEAWGFPEEFVRAENSLCERLPGGGIKRDTTGDPVLSCMCGNVICGRFDPSKPFFSAAGSFWTNGTTELLASTTEVDRHGRTRNRCNGQGYESVALIALRVGDESLGLLQLNDRRKGQFTTQAIAFWERLAGYLAVAVARARAEGALQVAQKTFSELVERAPFGIYAVDSQFRIAHMNASSQTGAFRNVRPVIGRDFAEAMRILWPEPVAEEMIGRFRHTLKTGEPYYSPRFINPRQDVETVESYEWELHRITLADGQYGVICYYFDSTKLREAEATAREADERLRFALEACHIGAWDIDLEDHTAFRSLEHDRIFGYKELLPQWTLNDFLKHALPEYHAPVVKMVREATAARTGWTYECPIRRADGELRWIWFSGRHRTTLSGRDRVVGVVQDITERKRAEEALRQSEEQFRTLADSIANLAWWADADGYITWYNRRWYEYTGTTPEQMKGWGWQSVHDPEMLPKVLERWRGSIATGESFDMEFPLRGADGQFRIFLTRVHPLKDAQGRVARWFGTNTDVNALKQAQEALRESEARLKLAQQAGRIGTFEWNVQTGVNVWTPELEAIYGLEQGEFGKTQPAWEHLVHPEDREAAVGWVNRALETGEPVEGEWRVVWRNGSTHWVIGRFQASRDATAKPLRLTGVNIDITERKRAEEALRQSEERLKLALREKEVMLKEIHHRVKNNLQVIASLVDLQTDTLADSAQHWVFQDVRDRVRSMALVHEKLYLSEDLARVDFADYARSLVDYLARSHASPERDISVKADLQPVLLSIERAVPCGLILNELVSNAFKYAFRGRARGELTARLATDPHGRVFLGVSDDGVGLPTGLDWRQSGSLGLRLICLLVGQLHATAEVRTQGGTEFTISFESEKPGERK